MKKVYRTDIDGLRAFAVISVILFHLGFVPNGYLGVDIFFVISGYLITGIVYREVVNDKFSILKFYERRIRRIIPLVLFTTLVAFIIGLLFMLPDDLENLSQSVFASNFSVNNILMYITSNDYWAVKNDYKPLMHTWSLGIEEQFYLLYPFLFFLLSKKRIKYILPVLIALTILSIGVFIFQNDPAKKFYFIQYRFFELSVGGIAAIYFNSNNLNYKSNKNQIFLFIALIGLMIILFAPLQWSNDVKVILTTILTTVVLVFGDIHFVKNKIYKFITSNKPIAMIGKISFSIYMWHQIVFSFARYIKLTEITAKDAIILSFVTLVLSFITYYTIENTFRNRKKWKTKSVLIFLSIVLFLITTSSLYVYTIGGIVRDVPELGLKFEAFPEKMNFFSGKDNIQIHYNERIRELDKPFSKKTDKPKVLVIGNSFGRDFVNVLLESDFKDDLEIRYFDSFRIFKDTSLKERIQNADFVFYTNGDDKEYIKKIEEEYQVSLPKGKLYLIGIKDFGASNGINYNHIGKKGFNPKTYRAKMKDGIFEKNNRLKEVWGDQYIDLIGLISDSKGNVLVFTPDLKFISQDTMHFTKFGAVYFSELLEDSLKQILLKKS